MVAAWVAVHLYDRQVVLGSLAEKRFNERWRPVNAVPMALTRAVGYELDPVKEQNFRPE